ncbi:NTP transferase domain-containing protein [Stappia sp.]|uniref:phosphocholine cytidylyltransferase family protein n=1 Tax=Stappia sp. TaxID=1870903 RepID=UPI003A991AC1
MIDHVPCKSRVKLRSEPDHAHRSAGDQGPVRSAIVTAAGLGSRLGILTRNQPKALVAVAGSPLLVRLANQLENAGVRELTVVLGYRGEQIRQAIGTELGAMTVRYVETPDYETTNNIASIARVPAQTRPVVISDCDVFLSELPPSWMCTAGIDILVPTRPLAAGEAGTVLRPEKGGWRMLVLRDVTEIRSGDRKTISLYLLFSASLLNLFFKGVAEAVAAGFTERYYEDVLADLLTDHFSISNIAIEEADLSAFEVDRPSDLQSAERWAAAQVL